MDKSTFRQKARAQLRAIPAGRRRILDRRINRILLQIVQQIRARTVMLYVPLAEEANVLPLIHTLRRRGIEVLVPFMEGESFRLVQYRLPLEMKQFGVREPRFSRKKRNKQIDIAIVPIVGTDRTLRRIGFGRGMYDRFFAREGSRIGRIVFVQRIVQQYPGVITDEWDIAADAVVAGACA